jgi:hypothetical protein
MRRLAYLQYWHLLPVPAQLHGADQTPAPSSGSYAESVGNVTEFSPVPVTQALSVVMGLRDDLTELLTSSVSRRPYRNSVWCPGQRSGPASVRLPPTWTSLSVLAVSTAHAFLSYEVSVCSS